MRKLVAVLALLSACGHEKPAVYGTQLSACVALPTEAEVDACMCSVALQYGRVQFLERKGIQCSSKY